MHQVLIAAAGFALGAIGRRVVGGVLGDDWHVWRVPHLLACIWLGLCMGGAAALGMLPQFFVGPILQRPWWAPVAIGVGAVVGHTVKGLWDAAGMGHLPPDNKVFSERRFWRDYAFMSLYGLQLVAVAVILALHPVLDGAWGGGTLSLALQVTPDHHAFWPLLGGLLVAPAYVVAWGVWMDLPRIRGVTGNPLQLAEWLAGGAVGAGIALMAA